jgi:hypothetical protein
MPVRGKPFAKGNPGKPKGAKNKITQSMREALEEAFMRKGGADYLMKLKPALLTPLLGKLLPLQIEGGDPNKPVVMRWQTDDESAPE